MWPNHVSIFSQTNVISGITTRLLPARRAASLSCKRQSVIQRVRSHSFFSWWPPSVEKDGAKWGDEQQVEVTDQEKICSWRCELRVRNRAGEKDGRRWQKMDQQGVWFGEKETEVENSSCVECALGRRRTGMETCCLHREDCRQCSSFQY